MKSFQPWLTAPAWMPLIRALLHTLWQGALAAGGLCVALRFLPARRANLRYGLSAGALALVLALGLGTAALPDDSPPVPGQAPIRHGNSLLAEAPIPEDGNVSVSSNPVVRSVPAPGQESNAARKFSPPARRIALPGAKARPWVRWAAACWLLGVAVCLARAARGVLGAGRLRRRCHGLNDARILALVEELRACLRLSRRVRLLVSAELGVPAVLGVFSPVILLPAALLAGVPADTLRAVLAHELAHVRRWDYLVNLGQMLVEALLFFNPFVWWISRRMRLEREACCDQLAAGQCQSPARYVEALVAVIESRRAARAFPAPLLAADGDGNECEAVDRARRLLVPGHLPALRLRWFSLLLVLAFSGLALSGLWVGARAVATTISPGQAPDAVKPPPTAPSRPAQSNEQDANGEFIYKGMMTMTDGSPLGSEGAVHISQNTKGGGDLGNIHWVAADGSFRLRVSPNFDTIHLAAVMEGCAPVYLGPFTEHNRGELNGLQIAMSPGFSAAVQAFDEAGEPIPGARLTGYYPGPPDTHLHTDVTTDSSGQAVFDHLGDTPLNVRVSAHGFQSDELHAIRLDPAKPYRWTLKKGLIQTGAVVSAATGQPIAGAKIKLARVRGAYEEENCDPSEAPLLATADAQGRFALNTLRADSEYYLLVEAPNFGGVLLKHVKAGQGELRAALGPALFVRGKLIHVESAHNKIDGKVLLQYYQNVEGVAYGHSVPYTLKNDGEAEFTINGLFALTTSITTNGNGSVLLGVNDLPKTDLVIDLAPPAPTPPYEPIYASGPVYRPGKILVPDSAPFDFASARIVSHAAQGPGPYVQTSNEIKADGTFQTQAPGRRTTENFAFVAPGWATVFAGPFTEQNRQELNGLQIRAARGFTAAIQVVDEAGQPIPGARVESWYPGLPKIDFAEAATDSAGLVNLDHVGAAPLNARIDADGYQSEEISGLPLDPAKPYRWVLRKGAVLSGTVTSAATGQPIVGAKIKLAGSLGPLPENIYTDPDRAPVLATTDAQGHFALDTLRPDSSYSFFVEAAGYSGVPLSGVKAGQPGQPALTVALGPELFVRGKVIHISKAVPRPGFARIPGEKGQLSLGYEQSFEINDMQAGTGHQMDLAPHDDEAEFAIGPLYARELTIMVGGKQIKVPERELPKSGLVIDLTPEPTRPPPSPRSATP